MTSVVAGAAVADAELAAEVGPDDGVAAEVVVLVDGVHSAAVDCDDVALVVGSHPAGSVACPCAWRWGVVDCIQHIMPCVCTEHSGDPS